MSTSGEPPVLGAAFVDAVAWVCELHASQRRKGTSIPYVSHLLGVASLVLEAGGDETEAIAGLLHDAVEDQDVTVEDIAHRCGDRVAELVAACTDNLPSEDGAEPTERGPEDWRARKERYLEHLATETDPSVLRVSASDKLHNARSIVADLRVAPGLWARFNAPPKDQLWYYGSLAEALFDKVPPFLQVELQAAVAEMVALTDLEAETGAWQEARPKP
jgi:(p)ppGpp synthase/HD superfamily hydrolase